MNKREFLSKLKEYLSYELPDFLVRKEIQYYTDYIDSEAAGGRSVEEIIEDLGDPQLIARSVIDAKKSGPDGIPGSADDVDYSKEMYGNASSDNSGSSYGSGGSSYGGSTSGGYDQNQNAGGSNTRSGNPFGGNIRTYNFGCFTGILILLIFISVLTLVGALLGALSPILAPICMVALILWLLKRTGGGLW